MLFGCFDPRSRAGSDQHLRRCIAHERCFDPRSRAGSDSTLPPACTTNSSFRSALPCGERLAITSSGPPRSRFDPRSRAGSDTTFYPGQAALFGFDPRSRAGSDLDRFAFLDWTYDVSIRAPVRGATRIPIPPVFRRPCFDPRSRAGSDSFHGLRKALTAVSIRAPVRGATKCLRLVLRLGAVSIRAPVRGAT